MRRLFALALALVAITPSFAESPISGPKGSGGGGGQAQIFPPFTAVVDGNYAWVNQSTATDTVNANGGISLTIGTGSATNINIRKLAAPATPYTITVAVLATMINASFQNVGLCFRDSGTGKLVTYQLESDSSATQLVVSHYNSATSFNANVLTQSAVRTSDFVWLRMKDDGTNFTFSVSMDGYAFTQVKQEGRTAFLATPNEIGFFIDNENSSFGLTAEFLSWVKT